MVSLNSITACTVDGKSHNVANLNGTVLNLTLVEVDAVSLLGINNGKAVVTKSDDTAVTNLAAALTVEYGLICYDGALTLGYRVNSLIACEDRDDLTLALICAITEELGCAKVLKKRLRAVGPAGDVA